MSRVNTYRTIFAPTLTAGDDEPRHILTHRDGATLCGMQSSDIANAEQHAPQSHRRERLCSRCAQRYIRKAIEAQYGE